MLIDRKKLSFALKGLSNTVGSKVIQACDNVLVSVSKDTLWLSTTNLQAFTAIKIKDIDNEKDEQITFLCPFKKLVKFIDASDIEQVELIFDSNCLVVGTTGTMRIPINKDINSFPVPNLDANDLIVWNANALNDVLSSVVGPLTYKTEFPGFYLVGNSFCATTDRTILSVLFWGASFADCTGSLVPKDIMKTLKFCKDRQIAIGPTVDNNMLLVECNIDEHNIDYYCSTRLLNNKFPTDIGEFFKGLLSGTDYRITLNTNSLISVLNRAAATGGDFVKLTIAGPNVLTVSSSSELNSGTQFDELVACTVVSSMDGDDYANPKTITYPIKKLITIISPVDTEDVTISICGSILVVGEYAIITEEGYAAALSNAI